MCPALREGRFWALVRGGPGRLVVVDTAWTSCGASAEIVAQVAERLAGVRDLRVQRMGFAPTTCPTTPALEALKAASEAWGKPAPDDALAALAAALG